MEKLTKPQVAIQKIKVAPAEVLSKLQPLQQQVSELITQRNKLAEKTRHLSEEARHAALKRSDE